LGDDSGSERATEADLLAAPDYREYEKPPTRRGGVRGGAAVAAAEKVGDDYFDIPAFLRRQAD
jgi:cell division protein FtsZ